MPDSLTPKESLELQKALLSAFRSPSNLEQMVFFQLGENLSSIVAGGSLSATTMQLIKWALDNSRVDDLIKGAREANSGNLDLRNFAETYYANHSTVVPPPTLKVSLTPQQRTDILGLLLRLPIAGDPQARGTLLSGPLQSLGLNRNFNNAQTDFTTIIDQLDRVGRLADGTWPLPRFLDNAASYVLGTEVGDGLQAISQALLKAYQEQTNA